MFNLLIQKNKLKLFYIELMKKHYKFVFLFLLLNDKFFDLVSLVKSLYLTYNFLPSSSVMRSFSSTSFIHLSKFTALSLVPLKKLMVRSGNASIIPKLFPANASSLLTLTAPLINFEIVLVDIFGTLLSSPSLD